MNECHGMVKRQQVVRSRGSCSAHQTSWATIKV